jgi:hypothetical protein
MVKGLWVRRFIGMVVKELEPVNRKENFMKGNIQDKEIER